MWKEPQCQPPESKPVQPSQGRRDMRSQVGTGWGTGRPPGGVIQADFLGKLTVSLGRKGIHLQACSRTPSSHTRNANDVKTPEHSEERTGSSAAETGLRDSGLVPGLPAPTALWSHQSQLTRGSLVAWALGPCGSLCCLVGGCIDLCCVWHGLGGESQGSPCESPMGTCHQPHKTTFPSLTSSARWQRVMRLR